MRAALQGLAIAVIATTALQGCGNSGKPPNLMQIRASTKTPDEFAILPTKPLQLPENLAELPPPTPGGTNITDPTPEADAVAALGGNPERLTPKGKVTTDGGLVRYASRYGVDPTIRTTLAAEDLAFREKNHARPLEKIFRVNVYYKAYKPFSLDQYAELERWRAAGVKNVGAPPDPRLTQ